MNVDIRRLRNNIDNLKKQIKEYDDLNNNYFKEISKIDDYWRGKDADNFNKKMITEKKNVMNMSDNLEEINNFYKSVLNHYSKG